VERYLEEGGAMSFNQMDYIVRNTAGEIFIEYGYWFSTDWFELYRVISKHCRLGGLI